MPRKIMLLGASALLLAGLVPAISPASAEPLGPPRDENRYVNLADVAEGQPLRSIKPNSITPTSTGRIEIYGSVGDNEGGMDWRTVNAFSRLVSSVPEGHHSYTTLFNSLYDDRGVSYNSTSNRFTVASPQEVFAPTAAYLNQANLYADDVDPKTGDSIAERNRRKYLHVLGAKESMDEAYVGKSSLARLMRLDAADYRQCPGDGGCLSGPSHLMHSKYGAFEKAIDSDGNLHDDVVWITSSNLNGSSGSKKSNISIAIYGDSAAYTAVVEGIFKPSIDVAKRLKTPSQAMDTDAYKKALALTNGVMTGMPAGSGVTLFPSPRRKTNASDYTSSTDVEAAFLKQQADNGATKPGCKVYAVHSLFNSTRNGVKDQLGRLADQRCDIRIVLGDNAISDIVDGYFNMSSNLRELVGQVEFANVHDKTLSYRHGSTATAFGGASNFTGTSLEYDELAFRADNGGVTDAIQKHSERIYQLAKGQTTWATPRSVVLYPANSTTKRLKLAPGKTMRVSPRVSPENALVTDMTWESDNTAVATVSADGVITGKLPGTATIKVKAAAPQVEGEAPVVKTGHAYITVGGTETNAGVGGRADIAPTLSMDNYQSPGGKTDIVVTWGASGREYDGVVKLQYYSGGWKTYGKNVNVKNGVGKLSTSMKSSKTWRAYGARLDKVDGEDARLANSTSKAKSKWSINTVRTRTASSTPRLYATSMVKSGGKIPFLLSWNRNNGVVRLQMRSSGGSWKTHSTHRIDGTQTFVAVPALNTKYWRIATSSGSTKVSNSVKVAMK